MINVFDIISYMPKEFVEKNSPKLEKYQFMSCF